MSLSRQDTDLKYCSNRQATEVTRIVRIGALSSTLTQVLRGKRPCHGAESGIWMGARGRRNGECCMGQ